MGLKYRYLFECNGFRLPESLRNTLFNAFDFSLSTLRKYYKLISKKIYTEIEKEKFSEIVEIGAGQLNASLELHKLIKDRKITIIVCDITRIKKLYKKLEKKTKGKINLFIIQYQQKMRLNISQKIFGIFFNFIPSFP